MVQLVCLCVTSSVFHVLLTISDALFLSWLDYTGRTLCRYINAMLSSVLVSLQYTQYMRNIFAKMAATSSIHFKYRLEIDDLDG